MDLDECLVFPARVFERCLSFSIFGTIKQNESGVTKKNRRREEEEQTEERDCLDYIDPIRTGKVRRHDTSYVCNMFLLS
jgi:hypothetical protein